jgi:pSer/pThr/pTyr-binding forkhead associated (FHA) protein
MHVYRVQVIEPGKPARVLAIGEEVEVGRDCDGIVLDDPTASRRHVRLQPTDAGVVVTDLGSANGTLVDGSIITEAVVVGVGTRVQVGQSELVIHEGREGDTHDIERAAELGEGGPVPEGADRISESRRELSKSSARTAGLGTTRPPRS